MGHTLSEHESKRLLAQYGVRFASEQVARAPREAASAAAALGWPVAVKLSGDRISHKSERGLVRLGLTNVREVEAASADLLASARAEDGEVALLVARMARGSRELIAGIHTDRQFGKCVMLGFGGVLAEAIADVAFRLVPLDAVDAHEMLTDLRASALLGPVRGEPPIDADAVAAVLLGLGELAEARPDVITVDVNPLVIVDGVPIGVDALVELADDAEVP